MRVWKIEDMHPIFSAIFKRFKRENYDLSVGHGHSGSFGVAYFQRHSLGWDLQALFDFALR